MHRPLAAGIRLARDRAQGGRDQNSCANHQRPSLGAPGVALLPFSAEHDVALPRIAVA